MTINFIELIDALEKAEIQKVIGEVPFNLIPISWVEDDLGPASVVSEHQAP